MIRSINKLIECTLNVSARAFPLLVLLFLSAMFVPLSLAAPGDLVIPRKEGSMSAESLPASIFPHWIHRIRYRCDACHNSLFEMKVGTTEITMDMMKEKKSCGTCHNGENAFVVSFDTCDRCHTVADD